LIFAPELCLPGGAASTSSISQYAQSMNSGWHLVADTNTSTEHHFMTV
jgi:hypothetical protein